MNSPCCFQVKENLQSIQYSHYALLYFLPNEIRFKVAPCVMRLSQAKNQAEFLTSVLEGFLLEFKVFLSLSFFKNIQYLSRDRSGSNVEP